VRQPGNPFRVGDIVVLKRSAALSGNSQHYEYRLWALTRLRVTVSDDDGVLVQAIDERPDRDWIMSGKRGEDPQEAYMAFRLHELEFYT
jgi:hypothetical protein